MSEQEFSALREEAHAIIARLEFLLEDCAEAHTAAMAELYQEAA
jgi:hypothetical protein